MSRDELIAALLVERFGPVQSPPPPIAHTPPQAAQTTIPDRPRLRLVGGKQERRAA
jgi:hypothetical protein